MTTPDPRLLRRDFLEAAGAAAMAPALIQNAAGAAEKNSKMIGIQVGSISFFDEGVDGVLDVFQQRARRRASHAMRLIGTRRGCAATALTLIVMSAR